MGGVVDAVGGLFGVEGGDSVDPLQYQPFNVQSALGQAQFGDGSANVQLSPELQQAYSGLLGASQQRLGQAQDLQGTLGFLGRVTQPQFERQQLSQESRLFNQGLLGSTTGQLQQQGLRKAQNQTLLQNALQTQAQQTQQAQGLLGSALQTAQGPLALGQFGANLGQGELDAQLGTQSLRNQAQQRQQDFFGGLVGTAADAGAFSGLGGAITSGIGGLFSDIRLKKNIKKIGDYTYTWDWNDKAVQVGADTYPTTGVIAQEIIDIVPEAVFEGKHGYLMVDYSKVA